jgi:hypothetical protein
MRIEKWARNRNWVSLLVRYCVENPPLRTNAQARTIEVGCNSE